MQRVTTHYNVVSRSHGVITNSQTFHDQLMARGIRWSPRAPRFLTETQSGRTTTFPWRDQGLLATLTTKKWNGLDEFRVCRAQVQTSKGKTNIWGLFYGKRSIEVTPAVIWSILVDPNILWIYARLVEAIERGLRKKIHNGA